MVKIKMNNINKYYKTKLITNFAYNYCIAQQVNFFKVFEVVAYTNILYCYTRRNFFPRRLLT